MLRRPKTHLIRLEHILQSFRCYDFILFYSEYLYCGVPYVRDSVVAMINNWVYPEGFSNVSQVVVQSFVMSDIV